MKQDSWLKIQTATMAALALFCSVGVVMSQRPDGPPRMDPKQMVERQVTDMKERLKLTSDQESKIKPILEESTKSMMAMREKMEPGTPPTEEMMTAMRENREATAKKINEVLTEEQQAEYKKMMSERRGFGGPGGRKGPPKQ
ncbi:MAG: hypothetical protein ABI972_13260 [Acidobacteriota bacterium]